jgi:hypothetical protein
METRIFIILLLVSMTLLTILSIYNCRDRVIIEKHINGSKYRALKNKVVGNNRQTISELIRANNIKRTSVGLPAHTVDWSYIKSQCHCSEHTVLRGGHIIQLNSFPTQQHII